MAQPIHTFLTNARHTTALVVGDVMVDAYLWGRVDRISPEAPVPVVHVNERSHRLGGAANVALNIKAFGASPLVVSVLGDDDHAATMMRLFQEQGLPSEGLLRSPLRRTTVKTRVMSGHQHIVRVDEEMDEDLAVPDEERLLELVRGLIATERPGVLVLEDYNKGVLTERVITGLIELAREAGVPVAVDPKKKNFFTYRGVDLFKPNLKELREGLKTEVDPRDDASVQKAVLALEKILGNRASFITMSEHGAYMHSHGQGVRVAAHRRKIVDVSGAGDTVIAVAALALAQGMPAATIAQLANLAGGLVCEEVGVVPLDLHRFLKECEHNDLPA